MIKDVIIRKDVTMALTWEKRKNGRRRRGNPLTRTDVLAARRVLRDAYRARHDLAAAYQADDPVVCRLRWVTVVTLLRTVGHALENLDRRRSPELKTAIKIAWNRWKAQPFDHLIFHEFIKSERDMLLKEYRFSVSAPKHEDSPSRAGDGSPLLLIGDKTYSAIEAVDTAIDWWEAELERIEVESEDAQRPTVDVQEADHV